VAAGGDGGDHRLDDPVALGIGDGLAAHSMATTRKPRAAACSVDTWHSENLVDRGREHAGYPTRGPVKGGVSTLPPPDWRSAAKPNRPSRGPYPARPPLARRRGTDGSPSRGRPAGDREDGRSRRGGSPSTAARRRHRSGPVTSSRAARLMSRSARARYRR